MTSSKSRASINKLLAFLVTLGVVFVPALAEAGRKRVVVLDLEGPKAEKFHADLVKLVKKSHTVVPTEKWQSTAEDLGADKLTDGNIKKVAKKLKIDAVITGKIEKRRDEYIIQLKVRAGKTGAVTGQRIDTSSEGPRIDAKASKDLKDELIGAIADMKGGRSDEADEEEEEERPKKKIAKKDEEEEEEEEEEAPKLSKKELAAQKKKEEEARKKEEEAERKAEAERKKKEKEEERKKKVAKKDEEEEEEEEEEEPKKKFSKKKDSNEDEETAAALKTKKDKDADEEEEEEEEDGGKKKKVAARDGDEEEEAEVEASADDTEGPDKLSVGERAVEAIAGLSFTARRMSFTYTKGLENHPPPYNGVPVAGLILDVQVFPLAFSHKNKSMLKNIGLSAMYDRVLLINSKSDPDGPGGNAPVTLPTTQQRWAIGGLFRYPVNKNVTVGFALDYGSQSFTIKPAQGVSPGIPNTAYKAIAPSAFARFSFGKITASLDAAYLSIRSAGQIENADQYGTASKNGFQGGVAIDYMLKKFLFARLAGNFETIGFTFKSGAMATNRDGDATTQDVFGAKDTYFGGFATVGYLY